VLAGEGFAVQWKMSENSLFAILLRSPWWISAAVAGGMIALAFAALPEPYKVFGAVASLPFVVITCIAGWKQFQQPSAGSVERTLAAVRAMSWVDFATALEHAYRRDGYEVSKVAGAAADFMIRKDFRTALVSCKRWKMAQTGVEPLRVLAAEKEERDAHECVYIFAGAMSDNARKFALQQHITLVGGTELARLLPTVGRVAKGAR
jgi:restriction system protein